MARSGRKGGARERTPGPSLDRRYTGAELLDRLLARVGAEVDTKGTVARFAAAIAEGKQAPEVIPKLFPKEPRFGGPEDALALYGSLLGLWDLLEDGADPAEVLARTPPAPPEPEPGDDDEGEPPEDAFAAELPERGSIAAPPVPPEHVDATWRGLAELPPRERRRRQDRYENVQSELAQWASAQDDLSPPAQETLALLCSELHEIFDLAFGDRLGRVSLKALFAADASRAEALEPAATAYVGMALDEAEAADEDPLDPYERPRAEAAARKAVVALAGAVRGA